MRYDPDLAPDREEWLALGESKRLGAVTRHHKRFRGSKRALTAHAAVHVAVETQLAEGHAAAIHTMERLCGEGVSRHEAIHAIGSALAEQIQAAIQGRPFDAQQYEADLTGLAPARWRGGAGTD